jgi:small subunit ribosomal protein S2
MRQLLEAGIHFGHQTRRWHPKMARYIFGQRNGIYIIDLQHTLRQLYKAYGLVRDEVANGGSVLFVGTKRQAQEVVEREAARCGQFYVTNRWLGGTLTNFRTVRQSIRELKQLQELETSGEIDRYSKKEGVMFRKRREKLEKNLAGIQDLPGLPSVLFVTSAKSEGIAVREANRLRIPCIGVVDTNCDPDEVSLPIPGNDDAIRALGLYCSIIADAVLEGRRINEKKRAEADEKRAAEAKDNPDQQAEAAPEVTSEAPAEPAAPASTEEAALSAGAESGETEETPQS